MNKFLLLLVILSVSLGGFSQKQLNHKKRTYQAPDGKLYVNKALPIYLYISTEPDKKGEMHQLQSDSTRAYANPMYLDTEGYNSFRSPSAVDTATKNIHYPLTDVVFELYADSRPPRTKINYDVNKRYYDGKNLYVGKNLKIALQSYDAHSGIEQILVSIDSSGYKKYTDSLIFDLEKVYDLNYYAVDNVGNPEATNHNVFHVDLTNPESELVFEGEQFENNISGSTKIKIVANDNISGISKTYYSIDDDPYRVYAYALNSKYLAEGEHTIKYYSVDKVGNKEQEKSYAFYVDKTPPILVDEIMGNSFVVNGKEYSSGRTKLKLTAVDNKSGVKEIKYSLNNEDYQVYEKPFYLSMVSGSLAVKSYAIDNVGNKSVASEKSTRNRAAYVDLTGPELKYKFIGKTFKSRDTVYINKNTKIALSAFDAESGVKSLTYSINEGAEKDFTEPFSIEGSGPQLLNIYGFDNVDNSNRQSVVIVIDNAGPDIYSRFSVLPVDRKKIKGLDADVYSSHTVLFLSATDSKVAIDRIYYSINDGEEKTYTGIIEGFKRGKDYQIKVKAYDKLGNMNEETVVFGTDNTGPEVFARFSVHPLKKETDQELDVYPQHVSLFLSVSNAPVAYDKIYYSINGGREKAYQGIIDGFNAGTLVNMKVRAVDRLGNQTTKEINFKIEE